MIAEARNTLARWFSFASNPAYTNPAGVGPAGYSTGYDADNGSDRRRKASYNTQSTDAMLRDQGRRRVQSEARDLQRNFSIVSWAIRRHLDYVSSFSFQARTANDALNDRIEQLMRWYARPLNCDVRGQHSLPEIVRMAEERRTVDGDVFLMKLSSGLLQAIEGDRVQNPPEPNDPEGIKWINGVRVSRAGRAQSYSIYNRSPQGRGYDYWRSIRAGNIFPLAYCDRFDQVRGVSPMTAAMNQFRDLYESFEYELAKGKVLASLGLVITSPEPQAVGQTGYGSPAGTTETCDEVPEDQYKVSMGSAPWKLELEPGDDAKFLTADTPGTSWREFAQEIIGIAIKALDLPFSFYDGRGFNFSQSKADVNHYVRSTKHKQASLTRFLDNITLWRLQMFVADGFLRDFGISSVSELEFEWVPMGVPWWNPVDEVGAATLAIDYGLMSPIEYVKATTGRDYKDVQEEIAAARDLRESLGLPNVTRTQYQPVEAPGEVRAVGPGNPNEPESADES